MCQVLPIWLYHSALSENLTWSLTSEEQLLKLQIVCLSFFKTNEMFSYLFHQKELFSYGTVKRTGQSNYYSTLGDIQISVLILPLGICMQSPLYQLKLNLLVWGQHWPYVMNVFWQIKLAVEPFNLFPCF